jgi:hypothetical protein
MLTIKRIKFLIKGDKMKEITTPLQAIRRKCYECSNGQYWEIRGCLVKTCPLYEFRNGHILQKQKEGTFEQISLNFFDEES